MSYFLNNVSNSNQFIKTTKEDYFVDKSELISKLNKLVGSARQFICITRPRRFGKSINAAMLASYYTNNLDTKHIFDKLNVHECDSYEEHLNKHNVIYLSFNSGEDTFESYKEYKNHFVSRLVFDIKEYCPDVNPNDLLSEMFDTAYKKTGKGFIFIIDEWDYIYNMNFSEDENKNFLQFLNDIFKDKPYVELAYMTGVLPIAKYSSKSTLNTFREFSALKDPQFADYFGFTHSEVETLCAKQTKISLADLEEWYNGYYTSSGTRIYNPRSVVCALEDGECMSYWTNTGNMDGIVECIKNDIDDVKADILEMLEGKSLYTDLPTFSTEKIKLDTREQIFSAMVVLGFLSYHDDMLSIPNKELKIKFIETLKSEIFGEFAHVVRNSDALLRATINKDTDKMSKLLKDAHSLFSSTQTYNKESTLASVIQIAYLTALKKYTVHREFKAGEGYADFVFIPNKKNDTAFILELKVNSTPDDALKQIKNKNYMQALRNCVGPKLAIGISYNKDNTSEDDNRRHYVKIEEIQ